MEPFPAVEFEQANFPTVLKYRNWNKNNQHYKKQKQKAINTKKTNEKHFYFWWAALIGVKFCLVPRKTTSLSLENLIGLVAHE